MKPNSRIPKYLILLCGLFVSFTSIAINSLNESEKQLINIDRHLNQSALYSFIQAPQQIHEKKSQKYTGNKKQPPLNIVASFIFIKAKTNQEREIEIEKTNTGYANIIHNFILTLF